MLYNFTRSFALCVALAAHAKNAPAQDSTSLTLVRARELARAASPDLAAVRQSVEAARARARQAGAFINPVASYSREQTGSGVQLAWQDIIALDQTLEAPGVRSGRRDAGILRAELAEAQLKSVAAELDLDVTRAYAQAVAAGERASLADQAARAFAGAATVSERRLREGDISGFAARRIRLEAARYAVMRAEAVLARITARLALATLTAAPLDSSIQLREPVANFAAAMSLSSDSLIALALRTRPDLAAAALEVDVANVETRIASRERLQSATLTFGGKREEVMGGAQLRGFVAGLSLPLPIWDRRSGAIGAAEAEARRRSSGLVSAQRVVARDVAEAIASIRGAQEQLGVLGPALQADAATALRSAQLAYTEGELSLIEWLDTVRAYYETETAIANLRAEVLIRAAVLERAVGTSFIQELR